MTIQHAAIADPNIHEPKGIASAASNTAYISNGAGSGVWKQVDSTALKGLAGDAGSSNKRLVTDGANGFTMKANACHGQMTISNNTTNFPMVAAVDPTLQTTSDYVLFTGLGAPWAGEQLFSQTFSVDRITVQESGIYNIQAICNISGYPNINAFIGGRFRINGGAFSPRNTVSKSNSAGDSGNLIGGGMSQLNAGDFVQIYLASSHTGNLIIRNAVVSLIMIRAL